MVYERGRQRSIKRPKYKKVADKINAAKNVGGGGKLAFPGMPSLGFGKPSSKASQSRDNPLE